MNKKELIYCGFYAGLGLLMASYIPELLRFLYFYVNYRVGDL